MGVPGQHWASPTPYLQLDWCLSVLVPEAAQNVVHRIHGLGVVTPL